MTNRSKYMMMHNPCIWIHGDDGWLGALVVRVQYGCSSQVVCSRLWISTKEEPFALASKRHTTSCT